MSLLLALFHILFQIYRFAVSVFAKFIRLIDIMSNFYVLFQKVNICYLSMIFHSAEYRSHSMTHV